MEKVIREVMEVVERKRESDRLERLGFKTLGKTVKELKDMSRKMAVAYEHFRFVRQEKVDDFNRKLREKSKNRYSWEELVFESIERCEKCPPEHVLVSLEKAQELGCFDSFEIAYIRQVKDPILFGRINRCPDRFFIDQWDDDVKIEDILAKDEG